MFFKCFLHDQYVIHVHITYSLTRPVNTVSIKCWKVAGALHNLKGIFLNSNNPWWVRKVLYFWKVLLISTYQTPGARSNAVKYVLQQVSPMYHQSWVKDRHSSLWLSSISSLHRILLFHSFCQQGQVDFPKGSFMGIPFLLYHIINSLLNFLT